MADHKRQHFVPKSHLKFFTNEDRKTIGVFHKKTEKLVRTASYERQAYEDYFYTKNTKNIKFETNILGGTEEFIANLVYRIENEKKLPQKGTEDGAMLLINTISQKSRTKKKANLLNELHDKMMKSELRVRIKNNDPSLKDFPELNLKSLNEVKIHDGNASLLGMHVEVGQIPSVFDLKCKLLINKSSVPFFTSDDPVVAYNQFLEKRKYPYGTIGLSSLGLQLFHPLSPSLLLIYYDDSIYKVGFSKMNEYITSDESIINQINMLQIINSENVFYFNNFISDKYIFNLFTKAKKYFIEEKIFFKTISRRDSKGYESEFNFHFEKPIEMGLSLNFIKEKPHTKDLKLKIPAIRKTSSLLSWEEYKKKHGH